MTFTGRVDSGPDVIIDSDGKAGASSMDSVVEYPRRRKRPSTSSESYLFIWHPKVTTCTLGAPASAGDSGVDRVWWRVMVIRSSNVGTVCQNDKDAGRGTPRAFRTTTGNKWPKVNHRIRDPCDT